MKTSTLPLPLSLFLLAGTKGISQTILIQEDFTSYMGTAATVPAGWNFSYNNDYTSLAYTGTSGPNAYKFGIDSATITTPVFANADTVRFWMRGASVDTVSRLIILYTVNSI